MFGARRTRMRLRWSMLGRRIGTLSWATVIHLHVVDACVSGGVGVSCVRNYARVCLCRIRTPSWSIVILW